MLTIRAMSDGKGYSSRHLEHSDYYAQGERVVGRWRGRGAELLGLDGEVKPEDFEALRQGLDPRPPSSFVNGRAPTGWLLMEQRSPTAGISTTLQSPRRNLFP